MRFDAPYYWGAPDSQTEIYAALVNDKTTSDGILAFLNATGAGPKDIRGFVEVNQRARRLWASQYKLIENGNLDPGTDELRIAYWLLMTSRKLADERSIVFDDVTLDALTWLEGVIADPRSSARLLSGRTVPKKDAEALVSALRSRDVNARSRVIQHLERQRSRDRAGTCARAASLDHFMTTNSFEDPSSASTALRTKILLILCAADQLRTAASPLSDQEKESAQALLEDTDALITAVGDGPMIPDARPQARKRMAELADLIALKSASAAPQPLSLGKTNAVATRADAANGGTAQ